MDEPDTSTPARSPSRRVWHNRNLMILVAGQWVSQVGNQLFTMAVYWTVLAQTGSRSDLGFVGSILSLAAVFGLVAGALVDRWNRRRTMIWVDAVRAALAIALVVLALGHDLPVVLLVSIVVVMALASELFYPAAGALLPAVVARDELPSANGIFQTGTAVAQLAGASLGGVILGLLGPVVLFGFNAASFGVSVATLFLLRLATAPSPAPARDAAAGVGTAVRALWRDIADGQRTIWASPFLRRILPMVVVANFAVAPINFLDVAWVRQVLHQGAAVYGLFGAAILVGVLMGSALTSTVARRLALRHAAMIQLGVGGLCIFGLSRVPQTVPDLLFLAGFGLCNGLANTMALSALQAAVPDRVLGRVFGTLGAFGQLAMPLGGLLSGIGAALVPIGDLFAGTGLLLVCSTVLTMGLPNVIEGVQVVEEA